MGRYLFVWSRGYAQLVWSGEAFVSRVGSARNERAAEGSESESGRGSIDSLSTRSRMRMRRRFLALPWEMLDPNPAMVTLTYPGRYWRRLVPDGRTLEGHRRAFSKRWERRWGPLVGVWAKEFQ